MRQESINSKLKFVKMTNQRNHWKIKQQPFLQSSIFLKKPKSLLFQMTTSRLSLILNTNVRDVFNLEDCRAAVDLNVPRRSRARLHSSWVQVALYFLIRFALHLLIWENQLSVRCRNGLDSLFQTTICPSINGIQLQLNGFWHPVLPLMETCFTCTVQRLIRIDQDLHLGDLASKIETRPPHWLPHIIVCLRHCHCLSTQTRELECELKSSDQSSPSSKPNWGNSCCIVYWGRPGVPGRLGLTVVMS